MALFCYFNEIKSFNSKNIINVYSMIIVVYPKRQLSFYF